MSATASHLSLFLAAFFVHVISVTSVMGQSLDSSLWAPAIIRDEDLGPYVALPPVEPDPFDNPWDLVVLPEGLIYRSYLAGIKESRMGVQLVNRKHDGALLDGTLGARIGLLRLGPRDQPLGYQMDVEGSAQVRLDPDEEVDVRSADFRVGVPFRC